MQTRLTKSQLRDILGLENDSALAAFFGISRAAIAQWPEDEPVPELRQLQAETKCPDKFNGGPPARRGTAAPNGGAAAEAVAVPVHPVSEAA